MCAPSRGVRCQRGAVAVIVAALVLFVLLGFLGLTMNAGHGLSVRGELQNATDSAALAAARELNGKVEGLAAGRAMAGYYSGLHNTDTTQVVSIDTDSDVTYGIWNFDASTFTPITGTGPFELQAINAVRVQAGREAARGNPLPVWLSYFLNDQKDTGGTTEMDVRASAVAVGGGPRETKCVIPLAFADCSLMDADGKLRCDQQLVFKNSFEDNAGLTGLGQGSNTATEKALLEQAASGEGCINVSTGEPIDVQNGDNINPLMTGFEALVGRIVSAPVVHPYGCPDDPRFNQIYPMIGFVSLQIDYVGHVGKDPNCPGGDGPCINVTMKCDQHTNDPEPGGPYYGLGTVTSRLVQ